LLGEHHVIMRRAAEAPRIRFLGRGMPELKESDGHVSAQRVHVTGGERTIAARCHERAAAMLRSLFPDRVHLVDADHIDAIRAINAIGVQVGVVEEHPAEVIRQGNVGIEVQPPAMILPAGHPGVECRALVEATAILSEQIGLNANGSVLLGHLLRAPVLVAGNHDHGVQMRVVKFERDIEKIIKPDAGGHGLQTERFSGIRSRSGVVHDGPFRR